MSLGANKNVNDPEECRELSWINPIIYNLCPHTTQPEIKVQCILDLQNVAQSMLDA